MSAVICRKTGAFSSWFGYQLLLADPATEAAVIGVSLISSREILLNMWTPVNIMALMATNKMRVPYFHNCLLISIKVVLIFLSRATTSAVFTTSVLFSRNFFLAPSIVYPRSLSK